MRFLSALGAFFFFSNFLNAGVLFGDKNAGFVVGSGCGFVVASGATLSLAGTLENNGTFEVAEGGVFDFSEGIYIDRGSRVLEYTLDTVLTEDINLSAVRTLTVRATGERSDVVLSGNGERILIASGAGSQIYIAAGTRLVLENINLSNFYPDAFVMGVGSSLEIRNGTVFIEQSIENCAMPLYFSGSSIVLGANKDFSFSVDGAFIVGEGQSLAISGVRFNQYARDSIRCLDNDGTVSLRNCSFRMAYDSGADELFYARFSRGALIFYDTVEFSGHAGFFYESAHPLTIAAGASLLVDHILFCLTLADRIHGDDTGACSSRICLDSGELRIGAERIDALGVFIASRGHSVLSSVSSSFFNCGDNTVSNRSNIFVENGELTVSSILLSVLDREIPLILLPPPLFEA